MAITKVSRNLLNTGVSDSSDATAITITSDEKVGIGTTSPSYMLTVKSSSENHLRLENGSELGVFILNSDGDMKIWAHGADERIQFLNGVGSGTSIAAFDSHGLKFGSDTAAANALDDYEEGLWTPTIASGGSVTSTSARYTKIGNIVRATARLSSFSFTSVDGTALQIGGLPYSMHSDSNVGFAWGNTGTQGKAIYFWSGSGGGSNMYAYWSGSSYDSTTHNEVPSGFNLLINLVYGHG